MTEPVTRGRFPPRYDQRMGPGGEGSKWPLGATNPRQKWRRSRPLALELSLVSGSFREAFPRIRRMRLRLTPKFRAIHRSD